MDDVGRVMTGFTWGARAYGAPWPACVLFQSEDGTTYAAADTALAAVTWDTVVNVLGSTDTPFQTDLVNTIEVALVGGDHPESVSAEEMLAGANRAALVRADGTAEIIHFQDVTATDAGTFVLSTLLRGRRGTEVCVALHEPGEMFVMLGGSAAIGRRLLPLDRVGKTLHLAAVARGGDAGNSRPQTIELAGNDLKPYAPLHLAASGSLGADITLSWVRRTHVGGGLQDGFGTVLLAEDTEEYELEVLGPDDDVRRRVTGLTSPTFTYTAAMQAENFPEGYPASAFVVYQISAQVGRGFAGRFDFPDAAQLMTLGESIAEGQAGSASSAFEADRVMAQRYAAVGGRALSASAYLGGGSGSTQIGIYADAAGEPGALLGASEIKAVTSSSNGHWEAFAFAPADQVDLIEGIALQVPAIRGGLFKLLNLTTQTVTIELPGQSEAAPQIAPGENQMLSCDGSDVRAAGIGTPNLGSASIGELLDVDISGIAAGQQLSWNGSALVPVTEPFDVGLHLPDLSPAGALLAEIVLARPVDFPAAFAGSTGYARIAAAGETMLDVQKNGSNIGTVTFAAASSTPVFALASPTSFAAGDRLGIVNEDPADATLAGVSLTFAGTRGS